MSTRPDEILSAELAATARRTRRRFAQLLPAQWLGAIALALWASAGDAPSARANVWFVAWVAFADLVLFLAIRRVLREMAAGAARAADMEDARRAVEVDVELRKAELDRRTEELRESESRFRAFMDHLPAAAFLKGEDGRYAYVNSSGARRFQTAGDGWVGKTDLDLFPADRAAQLRANDRAVLAGGKALTFDECVPAPGRGPSHWKVYKFPFTDGRGSRFLAGIAVDVTDRKRAEEALGASEERNRKLALVASRTDNGVVIADAAGAVEWVNDGFTRISGYSPEEVVGRGPGQVLAGPETDPAVVALMADRLRAGEGFSAEALNRAKDGRPYWVQIDCQPVRDEAGRLTHFIAIETDVTERKRAEAALARAKTEAEAANQAKSHFLANMSHEVRTPMGAILGYAEMLLDPRLDPDEQARTVKAIQRNGQHLLQILNDILDLSKIEAERMELERIPCRVWRIASEALSAAGVVAQEKGLNLHAVHAGRLPYTVTADPTRLRQMLDNLLANAVKFTEAGEVQLRVRLEREPKAGGRVVFEIEDNGIGMTPEELGRLFRPFTQADSTTTRRYGGTGLGLSICKRLAVAFGGDLAVRSRPGRGSCFSFSLPVTALEAEDLIEPTNQSVESVPSKPGSKYARRQLAGRVLLAEDSPDNQRIIRFFLERAGLTVEVAADGRKAVEGAQAAPYDIVLMDMQMPELDGYAAAALLRERGYAGAIVALTAHAMAGDEERCLKAGCSAYLTKPVDSDRLLETVARYQRRPSRSWTVSYQDSVRRPAAAPAPPPIVDDTPPPAAVDPLAALYREYRADLPRQARDLRAAAGAGHWASVASLAHKVRGAAGMYELPDLSAAAGQVEDAAREGAPPDRLSALAARLDGALQVAAVS